MLTYTSEPIGTRRYAIRKCRSAAKPRGVWTLLEYVGRDEFLLHTWKPLQTFKSRVSARKALAALPADYCVTVERAS